MTQCLKEHDGSDRECGQFLQSLEACQKVAFRRANNDPNYTY